MIEQLATTIGATAASKLVEKTAQHGSSWQIALLLISLILFVCWLDYRKGQQQQPRL